MRLKAKPEKIRESVEKYTSLSKEKIFFQANNIIIFNNDDFLTSYCIEENSIDLIVTSPPYQELANSS